MAPASWPQIAKARAQPSPKWADLHVPGQAGPCHPLPRVTDADKDVCREGPSSLCSAQTPAPHLQPKGCLQGSKARVPLEVSRTGREHLQAGRRVHHSLLIPRQLPEPSVPQGARAGRAGGAPGGSRQLETAFPSLQPFVMRSIFLPLKGMRGRQAGGAGLLSGHSCSSWSSSPRRTWNLLNQRALSAPWHSHQRQNRGTMREPEPGISPRLCGQPARDTG